MKMKHPYDVLIIGVCSSWFSCFLAFLSLPLIGIATPVITWYLLPLSIAMFLYKLNLEKVDDPSQIVRVEPLFLILNLIMVLLSVSLFVITFGEFWLTKETRYISLALGLPSLIAIFWWNLQKSQGNK